MVIIFEGAAVYIISSKYGTLSVISLSEWHFIAESRLCKQNGAVILRI